MLANPLALVTRILDKGSVVFSRKLGGPCIVNNKRGQKIQLTEETGTFVMDVEYLEPDVDPEGFARQGICFLPTERRLMCIHEFGSSEKDCNLRLSISLISTISQTPHQLNHWVVHIVQSRQIHGQNWK